MKKLPGTYDFDGNGTNDLWWLSEVAPSSGFGGGPSVEFLEWRMPQIPTGQSTLYFNDPWGDFGDFNGDGTTDAISFMKTAPGMNSAVFSFISGGQEAGRIVVPNIPTSYFVADAMGDYNGDGKTDVLWRGTQDGQVTLWQMNNNQIGAVADLGHVPTSYSIVSGTSDFTGDGKSDILWHGNDDGQTTLWAMNGASIQTLTDFGHIPTNLFIVDANGDFNGDGTKDILWRNTSDGTVVEWQMHQGSPTVSVLGQIPTYLQIVDAHGDYNGDGTSDVLWRNTITGEVVEWQMANGQVAAVNQLGSAPTNYTIVDATSDINGDGKSDILWEAPNSDFVAWQMSSGGPVVVNYAVKVNQFNDAPVPSLNGSGTGTIIEPDQAGSSYYGSDGPDTFVFTANSNNTTTVGGGGSNDYYFSFAPGTAAPTISDFHSGLDRLDFDSDYLPVGHFHPNFFKVADSPGLVEGPDSNRNAISNPSGGTYVGNLLYYATDTGDLYYEISSGGTWTPTLIAHFPGAPAITVSDIHDLHL
jgi:hypothetical protein